MSVVGNSVGELWRGPPFHKSNICRGVSPERRDMLQRRAIYLCENSSIAVEGPREPSAWRKVISIGGGGYYTTLSVSTPGVVNYGQGARSG
jgi:hypothetical protein